MSAPQPTVADEIERYLRTGDADAEGAWSGDFMARCRRQHAGLRGALVDEIRLLAKGRTNEAVPEDVGVAFTRAKVEPLVRGLFSKVEQDVVLATLEKSVVYVTNETIEPLILNHSWDRSAWDLANLYLLSIGAELLGKEAPRLVGISEETTCYVSPDYFAERVCGTACRRGRDQKLARQRRRRDRRAAEDGASHVTEEGTDGCGYT
jgi:hypothetical protein